MKCFCGAPVFKINGVNPTECKYCKRYIDYEQLNNTEYSQMLDEATDAMNEGLFVVASEKYGNIHNAEPKNYMAIWGNLLCKYEISFVENKEEERVLTCHKYFDDERAFEEDVYYRYLMKMDGIPPKQLMQFKKDAAIISEIQHKIRKLDDKREWDIFICYKETEKNRFGQKRSTKDSGDAKSFYDLLKLNYRVFFAPVSLIDKAGTDYEAEIFTAIAKSKVMLVIGSKKEYFSSTWVKSEWSRFLEAKKENNTQKIITLYRTINPSDLPDELSKLQAIDFGKNFSDAYDQLEMNLHNIVQLNDSRIQKTNEEGDERARDAAYIFIREGRKEEGLKILKKEAMQNSAVANYFLGYVYYEEPEERNVEKAFRYFEKAAYLGYSEAIYQVGFMYEFGIGVEKDKTKANIWYKKLNPDKYPIPKQ